MILLQNLQVIGYYYTSYYTRLWLFFFFIRIFRLRNFFWPSQSAYTDDIIDSRPFRSRNTSDALAHVSIISTTWPVHTVSTAFQISIVPSASIFLLFFYYHYPSLLILSVANKNLLISYLRPITGQFAINRNNYFSSFHAMGGRGGGGKGKDPLRNNEFSSIPVIISKCTNDSY